jgi:hypothetical protein
MRSANTVCIDAPHIVIFEAQKMQMGSCHKAFKQEVPLQHGNWGFSTAFGAIGTDNKGDG